MAKARNAGLVRSEEEAGTLSAVIMDSSRIPFHSTLIRPQRAIQKVNENVFIGDLAAGTRYKRNNG